MWSGNSAYTDDPCAEAGAIVGGKHVTQDEVSMVTAMYAANPLVSTKEVARTLGRSWDTARQIARRYAALIDTYRQIKNENILDEIDILRRVHLAHAAEPATIKKMSGLQAVTSFGILTDKLLLESGRPTSITLSATVDASMPDVLNRLKRALERRGMGTTSSSDEGGVLDHNAVSRPDGDVSA